MAERAVVVGGGLHGCGVAIHLALRGWAVTVIEKNHVGRHASGVNAGGVRQLMRHPAEIPLSLAAMDRWHDLPELLGEFAAMCGFIGNVGQVAIAETEADLAELRARAEEVQRLGWAHEELIDAAELRRLVPALSQHCIGGLVSRRDGHAIPYLTSQAFRLRALQLGVVIHEGERVTGLARDGAAWTVRSSAGAYAADVVVNCGGAWAWQVAAMVGETLPYEPYAPSMMVTARMAHFLDPVVIGVGRKLSFKQSDTGTVVIGGGLLGTPDLDAETAETRAETLAISAKTVFDLFPVMRRATIVRTWAGLEARMPDGIPVIGRSAVADGLFHAFGFTGHGFQLSPIVGRLIAELIVDGNASLPIEAFRASRFNSSAGTTDRTDG